MRLLDARTLQAVMGTLFGLSAGGLIATLAGEEWRVYYAGGTAIFAVGLAVATFVARRADEAGTRKAAWLAQSTRFSGMTDDIQAVWSLDPKTGTMDWRVGSNPGGGRNSAEAFLAEARLAGDLLREHGLVPSPGADPADDWLTAVQRLTAPDSSTSGSTTDPTGNVRLTGWIGRPAVRSAIACGRLAAG